MDEQKNNKVVLGIIGAVIGAFIGTIPWILVYVFANYIIALLSVLIAIGSFYGYKITKAKMDKKMPYIIAISSVLAITVSVFIIIPLALLARENLGVSLDNLKLVYEFDEFKSAIIRDYVVSLVFTVIAISGIVSAINKQVKEGKTREEIKLNIPNQPLYNEEEINAVKNIFEKNNALDKENGITKDDLMQELNTQFSEVRAKELFNILKQQGIIRKKSGKFYFFEKAQDASYRNKNALKVTAIVIAVSFALVIGMIILGVSLSDRSKSTKNSSNSNKSTSSIQNNKEDNTTDNIDNALENGDKEYVNTEFGVKFIPTDDMILFTKEKIEKYFGQEVSDSAEMIATNEEGTVAIYCFIYDDEDMKDFTEVEFLENTFNENEYEEIKTVTVDGIEFKSLQLTFEDSGDKYIEDCYVYKVDGKFMCFDYSYLDGEENKFDEMIQKQ